MRTLLILCIAIACIAGEMACVERLESSKGFACSNASDCWDNLPCVEKRCGAEPTPAKPEPTTPDAAAGDIVASEGAGEQTTTPDTTTPKDPGGGGQCKGNLDATGFCKADGDCCPGQKCIKNTTPMGEVKVCGPCTTDKDCPQGTKCCAQFKMCAIRCSMD